MWSFGRQLHTRKGLARRLSPARIASPVKIPCKQQASPRPAAGTAVSPAGAPLRLCAGAASHSAARGRLRTLIHLVARVPCLESSPVPAAVQSPSPRSSLGAHARFAGPAGNTEGYLSTYLAMGFANVRAGTQKRRAVFGYPPEH